MASYVAVMEPKLNSMSIKMPPTPGDLFKELRERASLSLREAGKRIGISHTRLGDIEHSPGRPGITLSTIEGLASTYEVSASVIFDIASGKIEDLDEILNKQEPLEPYVRATPTLPSNPIKRKLPLYNAVDAGPGALDGQVVGYVEVGIDEPGDVAYEINGNSMEPDIPHGSTVIVDTSKSIGLNDFVVAYLPDIGMVCKQLRRNGHNENVLASANPDYAEFNAMVARNAVIIGKVVKVEKYFD